MSASDSPTTAPTTPYQLVTEWTRFQKKGAGPLPLENFKLDKQQLKDLKTRYEKGINAVARLIDNHQHIDTAVAATAVLHLYTELPCVGKLKNFCVPDLTFESLHLILDKNLKEWANDDIIDCCAQVLCRAAYRTEDQVARSANLVRTPSKTFILRTHVFQSFVHPTAGTFIENESSRQAMLTHPWFRCLKSQLEQSHDAVIYLPITLNNLHWIAAKLDVSTGIWSFADSMNFSSIPTVYFDSCILLSKMLGISSPQTQPPLCNATFRSGVQVDGHSCGYFALNAIEADLFGTPLASTSTRTYQRLRTFWMICQEHVEDHGPVVNGRVQFGAGRQAETMEDGMFDLDQFHSPTLHKVGQQLRRLKSHLFPTQVVQPIHDQTSPPTQSTVQPLAECSAVIPKSFSVPSSLPIEDASAYREVESVDESDTEDETDTSDMLWSDTEYMEIDASDCIQEKPSGRKRQPLQRSNAFLPPVLEKGEKDDIVAPVQSAYALLQNSTATIETTRTTGKPMSKIVNRNKNTARAEERPDLWNRFVRRVKEAAPAAKVDKQLWPKHVWCPACRKWTPLKAVFQVSDFVKHYKDCIKDYPAVCLETQEPIEPVSATRLELASKSKKVTSKPSTQIGRAIISHSTKSIASFFSAVPKPGGKVSVSYPGRPCPGLSDAFDPRIGVYLGRTGAGGGGAPVLKVIIGKARLQLISMQRARMKSQKSAITGPAYSAADLKGLVNLLREKNYKWINHKNLGLVRAAACTGEANRIGLPCDPCRSLRTNKIFTNALQREPPASDKVKYTPNYYVKGFLHELALQYHGLDRLFDPKGKQSVMLRFATMLHDDQAGENKYEIYRGMSEAIYHTQERKSRGKGTQGLVRNQLFVNTMHSLALMSAYAYRKLHKLFSGPTIRYLKLQRQNMPAFRLGIDPENFDIAAKLLDGNGDTSPLCLSVDDTALVPKLRSLYDTQRETWSLVGHVSDTGNTAFGADLIFDREVDVRAAIQENVLKRGTKMRGYLLTSNTPGTPSILLAAFPIGDLITAEQLLPPMKEVIRQLERVGLAKRVISIVSDGAPTEVAAQNEMMRIYTRQETRLPPPSDRFGEIVIDYMMIGETKTITLVDAKHTSKNSMNAQCTGARVLVLGDHTVTYSQLLEIIQTSGSPLFKGDVVKSDRQDDQRMERYLSPDTMDHVVTNMPGDLGFQVYLYIFGELHSAVQSRSLCNAERMQMLLTTEYFLQGWQTFIQQHPDYGPPQFLPHAFFKLVKRLIRGVIGMILLLRDAGADGQVPLLPWRHMTETLEHYFGTARRFVQEFDAVQFAQLSKKISLLIDFEVGGAMGIFDEAAEEARSRRGYQHTYHIGTDLDVTSLATYPTESDVRTISLMAGNTAGDLLCALGMRVEWDLGPARALTIGQTEDFNLMVDNQDEADQVQENDEVTSEGEFKVFLDGYLKNMDPGYDTMLEEMINSATNMDTSQKTRETVAEVALAVTALEVETDANL
ncbi:hypothetical protein QFC21_002637 [Naganishia friedmannii]|uniref:Uncharacterized protein n=1 Tax=Naganishia friedmannii TaxID=89922 RepID=A0ACC2VW47_9TREE|nr:hypothetical protein QFC21_002637 [Naganishia friedmannii]